MPEQHYHTAADLLEFPEDGNKYEVVHGELLVSPSPRMVHQRLVGRLLRRLGDYLDRHSLGEVHPGGDVHGGVDSLVIPDLLVVDLQGARSGDWKTIGTPLLVVEVLSTSSVRADRFTKRRLYQELGIPVYWLVDAGAKLVEVWTPEAQFPAVEHQAIWWQPAGAADALGIELEELFGEV
jgi:Uma2 family endonuclease